MTKRRTGPTTTASIVVLATMLVALAMYSPAPAMHAAHAQPTMPACATLPGAVYIAGSTASRPLLQEAQRALLVAGQSVTIVYQGTASCDGPSAVINSTMTTATANYFTYTDQTMPSGTMVGGAANVHTNTCTLPITGIVPDIGVADVSTAACGRNLTGNFDLPTGMVEREGPVQAMTFVVPIGSTETSISGEAARMVFGFGGMSNTIAPWTVHNEVVNRPPSSGTQIMIGEAIGIHSSQFTGNALMTSTNVRDAVIAASAAGIGILAADVADANRAHLHILAYQHVGQSCGYLPDSSSTATDKVNVREGRYGIWSPIRFTFTEDVSQHPVPNTGTSATAMQQLLQFLTFDASLSAEDTHTMITAAANASTVPLCAMHATRTSESATPTLMEPAQPCHCLFESLRGTPPGQTACMACQHDSDCPSSAHTCRFNFCEAH
jgi:hypothetical protein